MKRAEAGPTQYVICHGKVEQDKCPGWFYGHGWIEDLVTNEVLNYKLDEVAWNENLHAFRTVKRTRQIIREKKADYYKRKHINKKKVLRFTLNQASAMILKSGVYGPWTIEEQILGRLIGVLTLIAGSKE
jgi:hypothetical protein